jgi:hypothetical protein
MMLSMLFVVLIFYHEAHEEHEEASIRERLKTAVQSTARS